MLGIKNLEGKVTLKFNDKMHIAHPSRDEDDSWGGTNEQLADWLAELYHLDALTQWFKAEGRVLFDGILKSEIENLERSSQKMGQVGEFKKGHYDVVFNKATVRFQNSLRKRISTDMVRAFKEWVLMGNVKPANKKRTVRRKNKWGVTPNVPFVEGHSLLDALGAEAETWGVGNDPIPF